MGIRKSEKNTNGFGKTSARVITAERVYQEILKMPVVEREKLFATIARRGFEKDFYKQDEVFDDIRQSPF